MKYLVYAFYPNLGIPVRVTDYKSTRDMYEYVSALRMTDTPYCVQDVTNINNPKTVEVECADISRKIMVEILTAWAKMKENETY